MYKDQYGFLEDGSLTLERYPSSSVLFEKSSCYELCYPREKISVYCQMLFDPPPAQEKKNVPHDAGFGKPSLSCAVHREPHS